MLTRDEAKEIYDETREWSYWTESFFREEPDEPIDEVKKEWQEAVGTIEKRCKDAEACGVDAIMTLSKYGVTDRRKLALAVLSYPFMREYQGDGPGKREDISEYAEGEEFDFDGMMMDYDNMYDGPISTPCK